MSIREIYPNLADNFRVAASERVKPGAILIVPWHIDANRDRLDRGLEDCGCAFAPDEPDDEKRL